MSVAEIRPYQPGDTIKQIDWMSTAKKSELMTKLTHQEEQLSIVHVIPSYQSIPDVLLSKLIGAISYSTLKYWDTVGALLGEQWFGLSRGRAKLTHRFELVKSRSWNTRSLTDTLQSRQIKKSIVCLYLSDFPSEDERKLVLHLGQANSVMLMLCVPRELIEPEEWKSYGYADYDLLSSQRSEYLTLLEETITQTRSRMQEMWGKLIVVDDGSDALVQLTKQWIF